MYVCLSVGNTRRNSRTICEPVIHRTHHKPNSQTKFTAVPILNAPQVHLGVQCSNTGRDKVYTDWMFFASRLSLQPHATLESSPGYASSVPAGYLWLIAPVGYIRSIQLHVDQHLPRTSDHLSLCFSAVSTATANRIASSKRTRHLKLDLPSHHYPAPVDIHG